MFELSSRDTETLGRKLREDFSRFLKERKYPDATDEYGDAEPYADGDSWLNEDGDPELYKDGDDYDPPEPQVALEKSEVKDLPSVAIPHLKEETQRVEDWHTRWKARLEDFFALPSIPPDSVTLWGAAWYNPPGVKDTPQKKTQLSLLKDVCVKRTTLTLELARKRLEQTEIALSSRSPDWASSRNGLEADLKAIEEKIKGCMKECKAAEDKLEPELTPHNRFKKMYEPTGRKCFFEMHESIRKYLGQEEKKKGNALKLVRELPGPQINLPTGDLESQSAGRFHCSFFDKVESAGEGKYEQGTMGAQ
ncbi:hypothetical protein DB88DRAFT_539158 [Papiliotrema laurentii]|uniref:Uncharacterized protein n=1 Tax=Papiliotrema laurentii TaxID=5418 RepID=A0AAD9FT06_PAPLA|nr:hypothetical protein DB88DRAFT_539158 [Papiliotrema laurentii]